MTERVEADRVSALLPASHERAMGLAPDGVTAFGRKQRRGERLGRCSFFVLYGSRRRSWWWLMLRLGAR
jgi:hypothetical protein